MIIDNLINIDWIMFINANANSNNQSHNDTVWCSIEKIFCLQQL